MKKPTKPVLSPIQQNHTLDRDKDIIPLVKKIIKAFAEMPDLLIGSGESTTEAKLAVYYQKVYIEVMVPLLRESNIKLNAIQYIFSLCMQPFQLLNDVTTSSIEMNRDLADAIKWGFGSTKELDDMRVSDLDKVLNEFAKNKKNATDAGSVDKSKDK